MDKTIEGTVGAFVQNVENGGCIFLEIFINIDKCQYDKHG